MDKLEVNELESKSQKEKIKDFSEILKKIEDLDDKKRTLWTEIYQNAITDRQHAYVMFVKLVKICEDKTTEHAVHGASISKYIEKMSKANDQLIKLADLITKAEEEANNIDEEDMYNQLQQ